MKYLSINDVMEIMGVSRQTIYNWFEKGLRRVEVGGSIRIKETDLEDFIKEVK